jgi:anthranilate phosphoribosyltransferase
MALRDHLPKVIGGGNLERAEAVAAMDSLMSGEATPAQIGAFLVALRMKGETADEIAGFAQVMREKATRVNAPEGVIDTCGTGGDGKATFNISTAAALVAAGAGARVAKHGNRSVSSSSGSADVLTELGVKVDCGVPTVEACIEKAGVGFLFAPMLHAAMKHAIGPRRELGVRTVFNVLGPLTNPAGARRQLLGIFDATLAEKLGQVLALLGTEMALVVASDDGLDELTTSAPSRVVTVAGDAIVVETFDPGAFGLPRARLEDLVVDGPRQSAAAITDVLDGKPGPQRDVVQLNAAGAILVAGIADGWPSAMAKAGESIVSGAAKKALATLVEVSNA